MKRHIKLFEDFSPSPSDEFKFEEYDGDRFKSIEESIPDELIEDWNDWYNDTRYYFDKKLMERSNGTVKTRFGTWHFGSYDDSDGTMFLTSEPRGSLGEGDFEVQIGVFPYINGTEDALISGASRITRSDGSSDYIDGSGDRCTVYGLTGVLTGGKPPSLDLAEESAERLLRLISGTIDALMSHIEVDTEKFMKRKRSRGAFGRF